MSDHTKARTVPEGNTARAWIISVVFGAVTLLTHSAQAQVAHLKSPIELYGNELFFDIQRNGQKLGHHQVLFSNDDGDTIVRSTSKIRVEILFIPAYSFDYASTARWSQGRLVALTAQTNDGGNLSDVSAHAHANLMKITGSKGEATAELGIFPTNHWHKGVTSKTRVLNTITGAINAVTIRNMGRMPITTERGKVNATHYVYAGDLQAEAWYDDAGRWVKLRFPGKDGSTIEFLCRKCQGGAVRTSAH